MFNWRRALRFIGLFSDYLHLVQGSLCTLHHIGLCTWSGLCCHLRVPRRLHWCIWRLHWCIWWPLLFESTMTVTLMYMIGQFWRSSAWRSSGGWRTKWCAGASRHSSCRYQPCYCYQPLRHPRYTGTTTISHWGIPGTLVRHPISHWGILGARGTRAFGYLRIPTHA